MKRILVLGVYCLDSQPNTAWRTIGILNVTKKYKVQQAWVSLGRGIIPIFTQRVVQNDLDPKPWWFHINDLLDQTGIDPHDWDYVCLCQDDADLPVGFLDIFMPIMEECGFDAAQGARPSDSYNAHAVSNRVPGLKARWVQFIEVGPLSIYNRRAMKLMLEDGRFPGKYPFGIDAQFAWKAQYMGIRIGYIDAIPVGHSRPYCRDPIRQKWRQDFWTRAEADMPGIIQLMSEKEKCKVIKEYGF